MNIYVFRHGDTSQSKNPTSKLIHHSDTHDLPILPDGVEALKREGDFLKDISTDANFCSPYLRCRESAKIAGKVSDKHFKIDTRIAEFEGNESFNSFRERVKDFLEYLKDKKYSSVSVCTHGAVIAAIKHLASNKKFYLFQILDYPRPGILTIIKDGKVIQKDFN